jgi:hypothetical protein
VSFGWLSANSFGALAWESATPAFDANFPKYLALNNFFFALLYEPSIISTF